MGSGLCQLLQLVPKLAARLPRPQSLISAAHGPCMFCSSNPLPRPAQRALSDRKENGTANHAEHAKGSGASQGQDNAFDLKARLAEVE
jgi:hypothetical protein